MSMEVSLRCHGTSVTTGLAPAYAEELPGYTPRDYSTHPLVRRQSTEHVYNIIEKNRTWVTLKLYSSAKSPLSLPTYFEKEKITGLLEINAEKGDSIHSITAMITGRVITGSHSSGSFTFLNQSSTIWSKSGGFQRSQSSFDGTSSSKLRGTCKWPLSLSLPRKVNVTNSHGDTDCYPLPETFLERQMSASIQYDFTLLIGRGKLRTDNHIKTAFGYVPNSKPEQPPLLRQLAYQNGQPVPGPWTDTEGWHTLAPVNVRGVMHNASVVDVEFALSIAKPLSYTRGSVIPCCLVVRANTPETLERFSTPSALSFCLRRLVSFSGDLLQPPSSMSMQEYSSDIGSAVIWWPTAGDFTNSDTRHLQGEIKLPKDLRPTTTISHFRVSYQVAFQSFNVEQFRPESRVSLSKPVEITTMYANGQRSQALAPPVYTP